MEAIIVSLVTRKVLSHDANNTVSGLVRALDAKKVQEFEIGEIFVGREVLSTVMPVLLGYNLSFSVRQEGPCVYAQIRCQYEHWEIFWLASHLCFSSPFPSLSLSLLGNWESLEFEGWEIRDWIWGFRAACVSRGSRAESDCIRGQWTFILIFYLWKLAIEVGYAWVGN